METKRTYGQFCGLARALDLVGERWALLVVRELATGPKRFGDLLDGLPGVSTNVLAARLRELEGAGVVRRASLPPPAGSRVYELTEYGRELEPALLALGRWGAQTLGRRGPEQTLRSSWLAVALKAFFRPRSSRTRADYEARLSSGTFAVRVRGREVEITAGSHPEARLVFAGEDEELIAFLWGGPATELRVLAGDPAELEGFREHFGFAEPVPA